jgi:tetratricopeptide (TPR) repeat protein/SAM-dependent methyltransferase
VNRKQRRASKSAPEPVNVPEIFAHAAQFHHAGRLAEAEQLYRRVLAAQPRHADSLHRLGIIAYQAGQPAVAADLIAKAIARNAEAAPYHAHLGLALAAQGKLAEAVDACRTALTLDPAQPDIQNNLGVFLMQSGEWEAAADCCRQAIALAPDLADAHGNLGIALRAMGRLDEALLSLTHALAMNPHQPDVLSNLALGRLAQGDRKGALDAALRALALEETPQNRRLFVQCVKDLRFDGDAGALRPWLLRALKENWDRPGDLARVSAELVRQCGDIAQDELLLTLLRLTPNLDIALEDMLTAARRDLLLAVTAGEAAASPFQAALAQQCFINEYIFAQTADEAAQVATLRDGVIAALDTSNDISPAMLVALAAYVPLHMLPQPERLLAKAWPGPVEDILTQQVREPWEEGRLRADIPRLTDIDDADSSRVQKQYEDNPYPRWVQAGTAEPQDITAYLRQNFPHVTVTQVGGAGDLDILVAGCGTGRNAIETAQRFSGARMLAVDLSLSSLAHAARKSRVAGVNIAYAQADLLKLGPMDRRFDMIEAVGVLHHLKNPLAGWRTLLPLLRPGGVMMLGFYSDVARRDLPRLDGSSADDIRRARVRLLETVDQREMLTASADFYTTSTCRDLLFHVQESRLNLAGIAAFLRENKLTLLGFVQDHDVLAAYRARFADDPAAIDLANWQAFEADNRDTFAGMYQFWVQKPA